MPAPVASTSAVAPPLVDRITLEVIGSALLSVAEEMGEALIKASYSSNINTSNLPVECLEMEYPLLVEEYALVPDSGGAGRQRGGLGLRRTIRLCADDATFLAAMNRCRIPPWGLFGGGEGGPGALVMNAGRPTERSLGGKVAGLRVRVGESITMITPGAGGYGPAAERPGALLARDLREGKVTR